MTPIDQIIKRIEKAIPQVAIKKAHQPVGYIRISRKDRKDRAAILAIVPIQPNDNAAQVTMAADEMILAIRRLIRQQDAALNAWCYEI